MNIRQKSGDIAPLSGNGCFQHKDNLDSSHLQRSPSAIWGAVAPQSKYEHHPKHQPRFFFFFFWLCEVQIHPHKPSILKELQRQQIPQKKTLILPSRLRHPSPALSIFNSPLRYFLHPSKAVVIINESLPVLSALCMRALRLKAEGNGGGRWGWTEGGRGHGSHTPAHTHARTHTGVGCGGSLTYSLEAKNVNELPPLPPPLRKNSKIAPVYMKRRPKSDRRKWMVRDRRFSIERSCSLLNAFVHQPVCTNLHASTFLGGGGACCV